MAAVFNVLFFVSFYCHSTGQIFFTCLNQSMFSFIVLPIIFYDKPTATSIMVKLTWIFILFFMLTLLSMIFSYISKLHSRMQM